MTLGEIFEVLLLLVFEELLELVLDVLANVAQQIIEITLIYSLCLGYLLLLFVFDIDREFIEGDLLLLLVALLKP
jgi:hypothetical protein